MGNHRAVFMDRDGTVNEEVNYLRKMEQLCLLPNAAKAIGLINRAGMKVVIVTNQSGVARGLFDESFVCSVHERINLMLGREGAHIDAFYFCPHHPSEGLGKYRMICDCRKPEPGLFLRASYELDIDLSRSYMIGDTVKDMEAARNAGVKGLLVRTGYGKTQEETDLPVYKAEDILDAVEWIIRDQAREHTDS